MFRNMIATIGVACVLTVGVPVGIFAQTTATQDADKAGSEAKSAGKEAGKATKDAAKATAKGTKKVAKKTAKGTSDVAKKTGAAIAPDTTSANCVDGSVQVAKTKAEACAQHGGVKP